jgi:hypothetical protein
MLGRKVVEVAVVDISEHWRYSRYIFRLSLVPRLTVTLSQLMIGPLIIDIEYLTN